MALENERKVKTGDRLRIPAQTYNSLVDMLRQFKRAKAGIGGGEIPDPVEPHNTILVKNYTGQNLETGFKVLRLNDPIYSIQDDSYKFSKRPAIGGYVPQASTDPIAITLAPAIGYAESEGSEIEIDPDTVRAVVSGFTIAYIKLNEANHEWANPVEGVIDYVESVANGGQIRIIYWEPIEVLGSDGSVLSEGSTGFPDDVVIAVVNLLGVNVDNKVLWGRDNYNEGCFSVGTEVDFYEYRNIDTAPGNSLEWWNNQVIVYNVDSTYGPFCYIPAYSGRVLVFAGIQIEAFIQKDFNAFAINHGIFFDFNFDLVNVDSFGVLKEIELYHEDGETLEHSQGEANSTTYEESVRGLVWPHHILSGQMYNTGNGVRVYGGYSPYHGAFFGNGRINGLSMYVDDTPVRLALRVVPKITYTKYEYNGVFDDILMKWRPKIFNEFPLHKGMFINYIKVKKDRDFCDLGSIEYGGSEGSIEGSEIGSVPEGEEGSTPEENFTITLVPNNEPDDYPAPFNIRVTVIVDNAAPVSPPFFYEINWGDGTSSSQSTTSLSWTFNHSYSVPGGPYTIVVEVTDSNGNYSTENLGPYTVT